MPKLLNKTHTHRRMNKYLKGIKNSDDEILQEIYANFYRPLRTFVENNRGTETDAKDVFQEALIAVYRRLRKGDFVISATFGTYFFSVGKYIWLKKIKDKMRVAVIESEADIDTETVEEALREEKKYELFRDGMTRLGNDCRRVLELFFARVTYKEIAARMNYTGEEYARRKKYLCTKKLMSAVKQDERFAEIYN